MDLSPMQPTDVPDNCQFIVGDLTESLADFDDLSFDLVHSRCFPVLKNNGLTGVDSSKEE
jgi:hypothetical protein